MCMIDESFRYIYHLTASFHKTATNLPVFTAIKKSNIEAVDLSEDRGWQSEIVGDKKT